jgi:hypothetical protein
MEGFGRRWRASYYPGEIPMAESRQGRFELAAAIVPREFFVKE